MVPLEGLQGIPNAEHDVRYLHPRNGRILGYKLSVRFLAEATDADVRDMFRTPEQVCYEVK